MVSPSIANTTVVGARVPRDLGNEFRKICSEMKTTPNDVLKEIIFAIVLYHRKGITDYEVLKKYFGIGEDVNISKQIIKQSEVITPPKSPSLSRVEVEQPISFTNCITKEFTKCPYCGSSDITLKSGNIWYCRDCGKTFEVSM